MEHGFARINDLWCNGNTTVFGTVVQGSSPCKSTNIKTNLWVRTRRRNGSAYSQVAELVDAN